MKLRQVLIGGLLAALASTVPVHAQAPQGPPQPQKPNWWEQSSLTAGLQDKWLLHAQGDLSWMYADGNTDGYSLDVRSSFDARYRRVTNRFEYDTGRRDIVYGLGGGAVEAHEHTIRNHVEYDLTTRALLAAGVEDYQNTLMFVDHRTAGYVGGGITLADSARQRFNLIGGVGYVHFAFDREGMMRVSPAAVAALPTTSPSSGGIVVMQAWRLSLPNRVTLMQNANITEYFDQELGQQYGVSLSLNVPIARHLSLVPAFRLREEGNIYTEALHIKELDRTFNLGVRVSFQ